MTAPRIHNPLTDEILALSRQGRTHSEIAKALGIGRGVVSGIVNRSRGRVSQTIASRTGLTLSDPYRADRLLRRFSWEDAR